MISDAQAYVAFCLMPWRTLIQKTIERDKSLSSQFSIKQKELREVLSELEKLNKQHRSLRSQFNHEMSHFGREVDDLLAKEEVEKVEIIQNGIRVTTKPLSSFKGTHPFEIDLIIGAGKPTFRVLGESFGFQLRCLNGAHHDSFVSLLLKEARLMEAAFIALDLIQFGQEGGPNYDDNQYY